MALLLVAVTAIGVTPGPSAAQSASDDLAGLESQARELLERIDATVDPLERRRLQERGIEAGLIECTASTVGAGFTNCEPVDFAEERSQLDGDGDAAALRQEIAARCESAVGTAATGGTSVSPSVGRGFLPDGCWGDPDARDEAASPRPVVPSSHYEVGCDTGTVSPGRLGRLVLCLLTDFVFQVGRAMTTIALWAVGWAYGFGLVDHLTDVVSNGVERLNERLIGPLRLVHLVWTVLVVWVAVTALRGRLPLALTELGVSILLAGLAGLLVANPLGFLRGAFDTTTTVATAALATGTGSPPPTGEDDARRVLEPLQGSLHLAFVEEPADQLNWGRDRDDLAPACRDARDRILLTGPHGDASGPRTLMADAGCEEEAEFYKRGSPQRLAGAVLSTAGALILTVLVAAIAFTIVVAQLVAVALFAVSPLAALSAVLPGGGRQLAWTWLTTLIRIVLVILGMSLVLALLVLMIRAVVTIDGLGLLERLVLANLVVFGAYKFRGRVLAAGATMAATVGRRLAREPAPAAVRVVPGATAAGVGSSGFGFNSGALGLYRRLGGTRGGGRPAAGAGAAAVGGPAAGGQPAGGPVAPGPATFPTPSRSDVDGRRRREVLATEGEGGVPDSVPGVRRRDLAEQQVRRALARSGAGPPAGDAGDDAVGDGAGTAADAALRRRGRQPDGDGGDALAWTRGSPSDTAGHAPVASRTPARGNAPVAGREPGSGAATGRPPPGTSAVASASGITSAPGVPRYEGELARHPGDHPPAPGRELPSERDAPFGPAPRRGQPRERRESPAARRSPGTDRRAAAARDRGAPPARQPAGGRQAADERPPPRTRSPNRRRIGGPGGTLPGQDDGPGPARQTGPPDEASARSRAAAR